MILLHLQFEKGLAVKWMYPNGNHLQKKHRLIWMILHRVGLICCKIILSHLDWNDEKVLSNHINHVHAIFDGISPEMTREGLCSSSFSNDRNAPSKMNVLNSPLGIVKRFSLLFGQSFLHLKATSIRAWIRHGIVLLFPREREKGCKHLAECVGSERKHFNVQHFEDKYDCHTILCTPRLYVVCICVCWRIRKNTTCAWMLRVHVLCSGSKQTHDIVQFNAKFNHATYRKILRSFSGTCLICSSFGEFPIVFKMRTMCCTNAIRISAHVWSNVTQS